MTSSSSVGVERLLSVLKDEYRDTMALLRAYAWTKAVCVVAFLVLGGISLLDGKRARKFIEERHSAAFITNIAWIGLCFFSITSKTAIFCVGGAASEAGRVVQFKQIGPYLFVFSAVFIYSLYLFLLAGAPLAHSLVGCIVAGILFAVFYRANPKGVGVVVRRYTSGCLLSLGVTGLLSFIFGKKERYRGADFVEAVPIWLILVTTSIFLIKDFHTKSACAG